VTSTLRTPERAARICELLEDGLSIDAIAADVGCSNAAIRRWAREDAAFGAEYARARLVWNTAQAEEINALADRALVADPVLVPAYRLAIDTRKWTASKMMPREYGDKLGLEHSGGTTVTIVDYSKAEE
jgi:hypothetical protein